MVKNKLKSKHVRPKKIYSTNAKKRVDIIEKKVIEIMKRPHISRNNLGQITVKRMGTKYGACISGTPEEIFSSAVQAYAIVNELRRRYGRRTYNYFKNKKYAKY